MHLPSRRVLRALGWAAVLAALACGDDADEPKSDGGESREDGGGRTPGGTVEASKTIGPGGGTIKLADGTEVDVPRDALREQRKISVAATDEEPPASLGDVEAISRLYEFLPDGFTFEEPIEVTMPYQGGDDTIAAFTVASDGTVEDEQVLSADGERAVVAVEHFCMKFLVGCYAGKKMCFSHKGEQGVRAMVCTRPITWEDVEICDQNEHCVSGACVCRDPCGEKECGQDACGKSCGTCDGNAKCDAGKCVACTPACKGRSCGDDGCGGSCGSCQAGAKCNDETGRCSTPTDPCDLGGRTYVKRYNCSHTWTGSPAECFDADETGTLVFEDDPEDPMGFTFDDADNPGNFVGSGKLEGKRFNWTAVGKNPPESPYPSYDESGFWDFTDDCKAFEGFTTYQYPDGVAEGECTETGSLGATSTPAKPDPIGACQ